MRMVGALCVAVLVSASLSAQSAPPRVKLDLDVGMGGTRGGGARDVPVAAGFGAVLATSLRGDTNRPLVGALELHTQLPMNYGTSCIVQLDSNACVPAYPQFKSFGALVGWETGPRRKAGGARFLFGPAVVRTDEKSTLPGLQARIDVSALQGQHAGVRLWTRGATASPFSNDRFLMLMFGVGLRFQ